MEAGTLRVIAPAPRVAAEPDFTFDVAWANLQVSAADPDRPMLGDYDVYGVLSADLSPVRGCASVSDTPADDIQGASETPDSPGPDETPGHALQDEVLGQRLVAGLAKIGLATRHRAWAEAEGQGLTPTQGQILAFLRLRPETGVRISDLAAEMAVTVATATVAVQALERKGLVQKRRLPEDGRARAVSMTPAGRQEAEQAAGWADFLLAAVDELTAEEQAVFYRVLVKMIRGLQVRGEIPISRMCVTCRYFRPHVHADPRAPHHCAYVDAPFGDRHLRIECAEHDSAPADQAEEAWERFVAPS